MLLTLERIATNIFIGSVADPILTKLENPVNNYEKEKSEIIEKIRSSQRVTESQFSRNRKFLQKLEDMAMDLKKRIGPIDDSLEAFKDSDNMVVLYDHKFNILKYNNSFKDEFWVDDIKNSGIFKSFIRKGSKENILYETITIYKKQIKYEAEFETTINNNKYHVITKPIYDEFHHFDFFLRIYTKL
jgi:hypothetical protein